MTPPSTLRTYRPTPHNLRFLAARLRAGEIVAVPTETVYGLAANAFAVEACRKIFRAKNRPPQDPLIVHVHSFAQLDQICRPNAVARRLAAQYWPGPLTLVLPKDPSVPDIVTSGLPSVAVRMPAHPHFRRLLGLAGVPLAAPSANPFGYISPTTAAHVRDGLGSRIKYLLDGGPAQIGLESTILDLRDPHRPRVLRPGAVTREELARTLGRPVPGAGRVQPAVTDRTARVAPGLLERHYSPLTPLVLHARLSRQVGAKAAYLFASRPPGPRRANVFWLDARGDTRRAAHRLFAVLRRIDAMGFPEIHAELVSGSGLGAAINDRLRRAAACSHRDNAERLSGARRPRHSCSRRRNNPCMIYRNTGRSNNPKPPG